MQKQCFFSNFFSHFRTFSLVVLLVLLLASCSEKEEAPDELSSLSPKSGCTPGKYLSSKGKCEKVGRGYYSPAEEDQREACPEHSTTHGESSDSIKDCLGVADYYDCASGVCKKAGVGFYSPYLNNDLRSCSKLPKNALKVSYKGSGNGKNECPVAAVLECEEGYIVSGIACIEPESESPPPSPPPQNFAILGITGSGDVLPDAYLSEGNQARIHFENTSYESHYELTLLNSEGDFVCESLTLPENSENGEFENCDLQYGRRYQIKVEAVSSYGRVPASNSPFEFLVTGSVSLRFTEGASKDLGETSVGDSLEAVLHVEHTGSVEASLLEVPQLEAPFSFKGGSFPGVGGSCGSQITENCEMVVRLQSEEVGSFSKELRLEYTNGFHEHRTQILLLGKIKPRPPIQLAWEGPTTTLVEQCSEHTIKALTKGGVEAPVEELENLALQINGGVGSFYADEKCTEPVDGGNIPAGGSSLQVYFSTPHAPQSLNLVVQGTRLGSAIQDLKVGQKVKALALSTPLEMKTHRCEGIALSRLDNQGHYLSLPEPTRVRLQGDVIFSAKPDCKDPVTDVEIPSGKPHVFVYMKREKERAAVEIQADADFLSPATASINFVKNLKWKKKAWKKRVRISLGNWDQSAGFKDMPVLLRLDSSVMNLFRAQPQAQDLRLVSGDQKKNLKFEVEAWNPEGVSWVWVRVPQIPSQSSQNIYLYFDNKSAVSKSKPASVWKNYAGVWHMGMKGASFLDSTKQKHHGISVNGAVAAAGKIGESLDLSGDFDALEVSEFLSEILNGSATLSVWVKTFQRGGNVAWESPGITGAESAGDGNDIFYGWLDSEGKMGVASGNGSSAKSSSSISDGTWKHLVWTRNKDTGEVQCFVNGNLESSQISEAGLKNTSFSQLGVIRDTAGTPQEFDGYMDEVRISSFVLSPERIRAEYKFMMGESLIYFPVEER